MDDAGGWGAADVECAAAGDGFADSSAYEDYRDAGAVEGEDGGDLL